VLAFAPVADVASDQRRDPVLVLAHQQVEGGTVATLHAPDQFLVELLLSGLCVHDFGHRAGAPLGPGLPTGRYDMGLRRKVPRHPPASGAAGRLPQAMPGGWRPTRAFQAPI